jgi:hypothetical protein
MQRAKGGRSLRAERGKEMTALDLCVRTLTGPLLHLIGPQALLWSPNAPGFPESPERDLDHTFGASILQKVVQPS